MEGPSRPVPSVTLPRTHGDATSDTRSDARTRGETTSDTRSHARTGG
jgi:hypothetical protein